MNSGGCLWPSWLSGSRHRTHPDSVAQPVGWRAPRQLPLIFRILRRGHRNLFFLLINFYFPPAAIPHPSVGSVLWWPQHKWAMCCPFLPWGPDLQGEKTQPSSPLCHLFWGISQRSRSRKGWLLIPHGTPPRQS